jgi:hypothetical protein
VALQWRFAGIVMLVIAARLLDPIGSTLLTSLRAGLGQTIPLDPNWYALAAGLTMLVGGLYILIKPQSLLRWGTGRTPHHSFSQGGAATGVVMARIMGVLILGGGLLAVGLWVRSVG